MNRFKRMLIAIIGLALVGTVVAGVLPKNTDDESSTNYVVRIVDAVAPQEASAGTNGGVVKDSSGSVVYVHCDYGSRTYKKIYSGGIGPNYSISVCGADTDQFSSPNVSRCIYVVGPYVADGWYYIQPGIWYKIYGATLITVHTKSSKCSSSKQYKVK